MLGFKKQTMVTTSTMEAENISTTKCKKKKKKKKEGIMDYKYFKGTI